MRLRFHRVEGIERSGSEEGAIGMGSEHVIDPGLALRSREDAQRWNEAGEAAHAGKPEITRSALGKQSGVMALESEPGRFQKPRKLPTNVRVRGDGRG